MSISNEPEQDNEIIAWINLFGENNGSGRVHVGSVASFKKPKRFRDERACKAFCVNGPGLSCQ